MSLLLFPSGGASSVGISSWAEFETPNEPGIDASGQVSQALMQVAGSGDTVGRISKAELLVTPGEGHESFIVWQYSPPRNRIFNRTQPFTRRFAP